MSLLKDIEDILILCAKYGVNAITTCEESFYQFNSSPSLTKEIDDLLRSKCGFIPTSMMGKLENKNLLIK